MRSLAPLADVARRSWLADRLAAAGLPADAAAQRDLADRLASPFRDSAATLDLHVARESAATAAHDPAAASAAADRVWLMGFWPGLSWADDPTPYLSVPADAHLARARLARGRDDWAGGRRRAGRRPRAVAVVGRRAAGVGPGPRRPGRPRRRRRPVRRRLRPARRPVAPPPPQRVPAQPGGVAGRLRLPPAGRRRRPRRGGRAPSRPATGSRWTRWPSAASAPATGRPPWRSSGRAAALPGADAAYVAPAAGAVRHGGRPVDHAAGGRAGVRVDSGEGGVARERVGSRLRLRGTPPRHAKAQATAHHRHKSDSSGRTVLQVLGRSGSDGN